MLDGVEPVTRVRANSNSLVLKRKPGKQAREGKAAIGYNKPRAAALRWTPLPLGTTITYWQDDHPSALLQLSTTMACPVNHPWFHALVFLLGVIVVLSRYARAEPISAVGPPSVSFAASAAPVLSDAMQQLAGQAVLGHRVL